MQTVVIVPNKAVAGYNFNSLARLIGTSSYAWPSMGKHLNSISKFQVPTDTVKGTVTVIITKRITSNWTHCPLHISIKSIHKGEVYPMTTTLSIRVVYIYCPNLSNFVSFQHVTSFPILWIIARNHARSKYDAPLLTRRNHMISIWQLSSHRLLTKYGFGPWVSSSNNCSSVKLNW